MPLGQRTPTRDEQEKKEEWDVSAKARELSGSEPRMGINWMWACGFTKEKAEEFIRYLDEHKPYRIEHRGIYPSDREGYYDIRFRPWEG
jgi:hypothetical protein